MPKFEKGNPHRRVGNGKGWAGPAKGASTSRFKAGDEHRGAHNKANIQAKIADREEVLALYTTVLRDPDEPTPNKLNAGDKLLDRIEGKAVQKNINENTTVRNVIRAPAKPADATEWMQQHRPQAATKPN